MLKSPSPGRSAAEDGRRRRPPAGPASPQKLLTELVGAQIRLLRTLLATIADRDRALGAGLLGPPREHQPLIS